MSVLTATPCFAALISKARDHHWSLLRLPWARSQDVPQECSGLCRVGEVREGETVGIP